jgi:[protein-PII] uridylyltransferase
MLGNSNCFITCFTEQLQMPQNIFNLITQKIIFWQSGNKHFDHTIRIAFSHNEKWNLTQLEVSAIDKQGVLSNIAHIFYQLDIYLVNARIS